MLEARGLTCERGERRLFSNLSFRLASGESLAVHGPNGSGKSSLLRIVSTLLPPTAGEVRWNGDDVRELREDYRRCVAYVGHLNALKEELTVEENLRAHGRLTNGRGNETGLDEALARIELTHVRDLPVRFLSQGQKRRAALARLALPAQPPLWILDEPFAALDLRASELMSALIEAHLRAGGIVVAAMHADFAATRRITLSDD